MPKVNHGIEKPVPQNIEAEEATLGAILIDDQALNQVVPFLRPEHFYVEKNGWIFQAFLNVTERCEPIDVVTICDELERRDQLQEAGGAAYVTSLLNAVPTAIHVEHYARLVERAAMLRQLIAAAGQIAQLAYETTGPADVALQQARALLPKMRLPQPRSVGAILRDLATNDVEALPTGFSNLDTTWTILRSGHLARLTSPVPAVGASWAYQIALRQVLRQQNPVAIFSPRLNGREVARRLWSQVAGLPLGELQIEHSDPARHEQAQQAVDRLTPAPLYVDDTPGLRTEELWARTWKLRRQADAIRLVIIDSLQFLVAGPADRADEKWILLKRLARAAEIPILVLSQPPAVSPENGWLFDTTLILSPAQGTGEHSRPDIQRMSLRVTQNGQAATMTMWFHPESGRFSEKATGPALPDNSPALPDNSAKRK